MHMKMDTRPDETFWSPEYSKRPFWSFKKCQKYKYAKPKFCMLWKILILRVCHRGIVQVNLKAALRTRASRSSRRTRDKKNLWTAAHQDQKIFEILGPHRTRTEETPKSSHRAVHGPGGAWIPGCAWWWVLHHCLPNRPGCRSIVYKNLTSYLIFISYLYYCMNFIQYVWNREV